MLKIQIMFLKSLFFSFIFIGLIASCNSKNECTDCTKKPIKKENISSLKDTLSTIKPKKIAIISKKEEKKENHQKIVAIYGEQWDFCSCVIANDSINNAFEKNLSDKQADKLMVRWEHVENKCKEFLTTPNTTPEQRLEHEIKVKKCLKNANKK